MPQGRCAVCNEPFEFKGRIAKRFCGARCQRREKTLLRRIAAGPKPCGRCGAVFIPKGNRRVYCSPRCGPRARKVKRLDVLERDGWVCGICDRSIDPALPFPDPGAGTADHVIPLSKGGTDALENAQAAHWACNFAKRDRVA